MNIRPKRTRRPAEPGRHTSAAVHQAKAADAGERPMIMRIPAIDGGPGIIIPPAMPSRPAPSEEFLAEVDAQTARNAARGASWAADPDTLRQAAAALRALPAAGPGAYLRAIMPDGQHLWEPLTGSPVFAGVQAAQEGKPQAGLYLGDEDRDGRFVIDVTDRAWLLGLRHAVDEALAALEAEGRPAA